MARPAAASPIDAAARLRAGARALGIQLDDRAASLLCCFLDELERWNARTNLVGDHDRHTLIDRHILDALAAVPLLLSLGPELAMADVGSGAGLPGVPLAIVLRPRTMWLVEPRKKRASFLRSVRRALPEIRLEVVEARGEDLAARSDVAGSLDAVVSRAVMGDQELQACARPLLRGGGLLIAYRGGHDTSTAGTERESVGAAFSAPVAHPYALLERQRAFRLDVWTRRFT